MDCVKIAVNGIVELYLYRDECIFWWNAKESHMTLLFTNQNRKDWFKWLKQYKELGGEVIDAFGGIVEHSTLDALIKQST